MPSEDPAHRPVQRASDARSQRKRVHRDAMVATAAELFASVGYAATTMEAVAAGSGMSVQSVYFTFHTKAQLLQAAVDRATPPPSPPPPAEAGPDQALLLLVEQAVRSLEATGPLTLAAAAAAPGDAAVAEVWGRHDLWRARAAVGLVQQVRIRRPLAIGVTTRRVSDVVYGLLSPQLYHLLVNDRGWSSKRYAAWSVDAIGRALWG